MLQKEQISKRRQEVQALLYCQTGPILLLDSDKKDLKTLCRTDRWDWKFKDQLFITRLFPQPLEEAIWASVTIFQCLAKGAYWSMETQATIAPLPLYAWDFESVFAKDNFNILLEHQHWDHTIELLLGSEPKSTKVHPLFPIEQKKLNAFLEENLYTR